MRSPLAWEHDAMCLCAFYTSKYLIERLPVHQTRVDGKLAEYSHCICKVRMSAHHEVHETSNAVPAEHVCRCFIGLATLLVHWLGQLEFGLLMRLNGLLLRMPDPSTMSSANWSATQTTWHLCCPGWFLSQEKLELTDYVILKTAHLVCTWTNGASCCCCCRC